MNYQQRTSCRICAGELEIVFDLGGVYPSAFLELGDIVPQKLPLTLAKCSNCGLIQLAHDFNLDDFYRKYYYHSAINPSMVRALKDVAEQALRCLPANHRYGIVVDIGANDSTGLSFYDNQWTKVAFEPALNLGTEKNADHFVNDYFSAKTYPLLPKAGIVTSIAMFYDLPDPRQFVRDVRSILREDGVWIIQLTDLKSMLEINAVDNICHEHLEYYSAHDICNLMERENLEVFRIEHNDVNGGSLRFYVNHRAARLIEPSVQETREQEAIYLASEAGSMTAFSRRIAHTANNLYRWLNERAEEDKRVYGLAASTKGNTLLQIFWIDYPLISAIGDLNEDKFGKLTIGSNVPIISEEQLFANNPDYLVIFAWHFLPFFLKKFETYLKLGGKFVVPLPEARIYSWGDQGTVVSQLIGEEVVAHGD